MTERGDFAEILDEYLRALEAGNALKTGAEGVFIGPGVLALRDAIVRRLDECASGGAGESGT